MNRPPKVLCALLTPWKDQSPNLAEIRRIVDFQIKQGLLGIFPISSVGEAGIMSFSQKCAVIEAVCAEAKERVPVWSGIPSNNADESIQLAAFAKSQGATGLVLMPPAFYPCDEAAIISFVSKVAASTDLPICLYNIPFMADPINAETAAKLARLANVVGIKDSGGCSVNFMKMLSLCKAVDPEFRVMTGREEFLYGSLMLGGDGCMTATSGVMPEVMVKINALFEAGQFDAAKKLQFAAMEAMMAMSSIRFPFGYRIAMEARGFDMGQSPLTHTESDSSYTTAKVQSLAILINTLVELTVN
ncbi:MULTISPECIES: dihydrodipicolinate synthase family protein [unclassified Agarivorans]|uniref:dihydrodipicolinate synthase family protein n=1 Tax=unclassified Agarivorans TaxID=2636026 RepID=UPI003D7DA2B8